MNKTGSNYKFNFEEKFRNDPIFSQFVHDVFKWILVTIASFFVVKEVVVSEVKPKTIDEKFAETKSCDYKWACYLYDVTSEDYLYFMDFEKDLSSYNQAFEAFLNHKNGRLDKGDNSFYSFSNINDYYQFGLNQRVLKRKILGDMFPTIRKYNRKELEQKRDTLLLNMWVWETKLNKSYQRVLAYIEENDLTNRLIVIAEKIEDNSQKDRTADDEMETIGMIEEMKRHCQVLSGFIELFFTEEFNQMESDFFEIIINYRQLVRTVLFQEKWRSMTTLDFQEV
jgi:hypothetical protein